MSASTSRIRQSWGLFLAAATTLTTLGGAYTLIAFDLRGHDPLMTVGAEMLPAGLWLRFGAAADDPINDLRANFATYDKSGKLLKTEIFVPTPMMIAGNRLKEATFGGDESFVANAAAIRFCGIHKGAYGVDKLMDVWLLVPLKGQTAQWGQHQQSQTRWVFATPDCTAPQQLSPETSATLRQQG